MERLYVPKFIIAKAKASLAKILIEDFNFKLKFKRAIIFKSQTFVYNVQFKP